MAEFSGVLTSRDLHRHIAHTFNVPDGVTGIYIDYAYHPRQVGNFTNLVTLSLYDPDGCRGNAHRGTNVESIRITSSESSYGFTREEIPAGSWGVYLHTHMVLPDQPVKYSIKITFEITPHTIASAYSAGVKPTRSAGWYRGNLHSHTYHSDGHWTASELVAWARAEGLDFVALTDHNTISGLAEMDSLSSSDLLTMGGIELTTFYGHAVVLGTRDWVEWRTTASKGAMLPIKRAVESRNGLFIIAHPNAPSGAICTGCGWEYTDMMPGEVKFIEIWNSEWDSDSDNERTLALWYTWLNAGHRLVATAGADIHNAPEKPLRYGYSVIWADELTEEAILTGLRRGHAYISAGPQLEFTGQNANGETVIMGDEVTVDSVTARWRACPPDATIRLIVDGEVHAELTSNAAGEQTWQLSTRWHWAVIEVRDAQGLLAVTNPLYRA